MRRSSWVIHPSVQYSSGSSRNEHTRFLTVLLMDGFMYFFVVFGSMLFNSLSWGLAPVRVWYCFCYLAQLISPTSLVLLNCLTSSHLNTLFSECGISDRCILSLSSCWAIATMAITRFLLDLQKRYHVELGPHDEADHPDEIPMAEPPNWTKLNDELQNARALSDPFYSYYVAPFPITNGGRRHPDLPALFPDDLRNDR